MAEKKPNKKPASKKRAKKTAAKKTAAKKSVARRPRKAFPDISSASWEHVTDRAALHALQTIPGFDAVIRKVIGGDR